MHQLHAVLTSIMPDGWLFVLEYGRVSMIEVSVDMPGVEMNSIHVLPKQVTTVRTWSTNGKLETLYLGKNTGNQWRIYNRGLKRKAKGQSDPKYEGTRIERVLRKGFSIPLLDLPYMKNPLLGLGIVMAPQDKPPGENNELVWKLFMDAVEVRTLPVALKLLGKKRRTQYRAWFAKHPIDWWKPELIWARWEDELHELGIADPSKW